LEPQLNHHRHTKIVRAQPIISHSQPVDLARIVIGVATLLLLVSGSLYILRPFLLALIWATTIVVATWPVLLAVQHRLGDHRGLAVAVMLLALLVLIVLPLYGAVSTLTAHADDIMAVVKGLPTYAPPPPPNWLSNIPLLGPRIAREWQTLSNAGPGGILASLEPYASDVAHWLILRVSAVGVLMLHLLLTVLIAGILYAKGETAALTVTRLAQCTAPENGAAIVRLVGLSIRAVALGIVVTALLQTALGGLGLWVAGVPFAGVLTALLFVLCLAQIGPLLPLLACVAWLFSRNAHVTAILLLAWSLGVASLDNLLRPILIQRTVALPMSLILAGVLGGLIAFGLVGLFVGPVILSVTFALMQAWIESRESFLEEDKAATSATVAPAKDLTGEE
jgi:predicted PurR-regulated permease PerM